MSMVIPGTFSKAADPSGRALRSSGTFSELRPAAVAAAGMSVAAYLV